MSSIEIPVRIKHSLQNELANCISLKLQKISEVNSFSLQYGIDHLTIVVHAEVDDLDKILVMVHERIASCNPLALQKSLDRYDNGDNDQPCACPICGARTDFRQINLRLQMHTCMACSYKFVLRIKYN